LTEAGNSGGGRRAAIRGLLRKEGARYIVAGCYNTAVGIVLYLVLFGLLQEKVHYLLLLALNYLLGTLNGYLAYKMFVFKSRVSYLGEYLRFNIVHISGMAVNFVALPVLVEWVGLTPFVSQGLIVVTLILASFVLHKRFTFRKATGDTAP
jgi:putative flippase GtrA